MTQRHVFRSPKPLFRFGHYLKGSTAVDCRKLERVRQREKCWLSLNSIADRYRYKNDPAFHFNGSR